MAVRITPEMYVHLVVGATIIALVLPDEPPIIKPTEEDILEGICQIEQVLRDDLPDARAVDGLNPARREALAKHILTLLPPPSG